VGDTVLVLAFAWVEDAKAKDVRPRVVFVDEENRVAPTPVE
jgi:aspartate 1-decarboxylase